VWTCVPSWVITRGDIYIKLHRVDGDKISQFPSQTNGYVIELDDVTSTYREQSQIHRWPFGLFLDHTGCCKGHLSSFRVPVWSLPLSWFTMGSLLHQFPYSTHTGCLEITMISSHCCWPKLAFCAKKEVEGRKEGQNAWQPSSGLYAYSILRASDQSWQFDLIACISSFVRFSLHRFILL
jgi:hypothetical protein